MNAKSLPFPTITSLGAAQRAQRHVADSITTLRLQLGVAVASALGHCPHRHSINLALHLWHRQSRSRLLLRIPGTFGTLPPRWALVPTRALTLGWPLAAARPLTLRWALACTRPLQVRWALARTRALTLGWSLAAARPLTLRWTLACTRPESRTRRRQTMSPWPERWLRAVDPEMSLRVPGTGAVVVIPIVANTERVDAYAYHGAIREHRNS